MKRSNLDALNIIENEGSGYAVTSYCSGDIFEDPKTVELWDNAAEALSELEAYLQQFENDEE